MSIQKNNVSKVNETFLHKLSISMAGSPVLAPSLLASCVTESGSARTGQYSREMYKKGNES